MGTDRTAPVVLGPVTWVFLARHADAQASEQATLDLKNQYLDAILPVYAVSKLPPWHMIFLGVVIFCANPSSSTDVHTVLPAP